MGFDNPYRNAYRDLGCTLLVVGVLLVALGYGLGKLF